MFTGLAAYLVYEYAPTARGSGIPEADLLLCTSKSKPMVWQTAQVFASAIHDAYDIRQHIRSIDSSRFTEINEILRDFSIVLEEGG